MTLYLTTITQNVSFSHFTSLNFLDSASNIQLGDQIGNTDFYRLVVDEDKAIGILGSKFREFVKSVTKRSIPQLRKLQTIHIPARMYQIYPHLSDSTLFDAVYLMSPLLSHLVPKKEWNQEVISALIEIGIHIS